MNPERYRLALVREPAVEPIGNQVTVPGDLATIGQQLLRSEPQELILCIHLDRKHRVRGYQEISRGGLDSAPCEFRVLFGGILVAGVPAFALVHNHPSGDPTPSADDVGLTRRVSRAAELLGIEFLDHLVVATDGWTSLHETGAM